MSVTHYSENPSAFPAEGGCACGQTRYRLGKSPLIVHCCHCTLCQREAGTAFCINALIESSNITRLPPAKATVPLSISDDASSASKPAGPPIAIASTDSSAAGPPLNLIKMPTQSGFGQTIARCSACSTAVWSFYAGAGPVLAFIRVGTLDRPWEVQPDVHIFVRSKREFVQLTDGKPQFQEFYPSREKMYRPEAMQRYTALKDEIRKFAQERNKVGAKF